MSDGTLSVGGSFSQVGPQSTGALALLLTTGSLAPSIKIAPQVNDTTSGGPTSLPGDAVSTTNGIWNNVPTTYTYVWQDCTAADVCSNISGATGSTYTVAPSDVGYSLQSIVTATNTGGMASATSSNQLVVPTAPVNTALPIITDPTGNTAGQMIPNTDVLTASTGTWTPANGDNQYSYQWQDCDAFGANCSQIMGATTSTYTAGSSDVGYTIDVVVTRGQHRGNGLGHFGTDRNGDQPAGTDRRHLSGGDRRVPLGGAGRPDRHAFDHQRHLEQFTEHLLLRVAGLHVGECVLQHQRRDEPDVRGGGH
jgi:hypothetical protein